MSQPIQIDELLTIADVARILVCSEANVYALIDAGHLPYIRIGKTKGYRIDPADLASFLEERKIQKEGVKRKTTRPRLKHIKL
jgi:excisionase family DNA binding protein